MFSGSKLLKLKPDPNPNKLFLLICSPEIRSIIHQSVKFGTHPASSFQSTSKVNMSLLCTGKASDVDNLAAL